MPRKRSQDKDTLVNQRAGRGNERPLTAPDQPVAMADLTGDTIRAAEALRCLGAILARQDGYLKIDPTLDGTTYMKWRFIRGTWAGFYVMVVSHRHWDPYEAFVLLVHKLDQVDTGERRPSKEDLGYF